MASLSTHVIDAAWGGGRREVVVSVDDANGVRVGEGVTDAEGRVGGLATDLRTGSYCISWKTGGSFLQAVSVTAELGEDRHYHVPLLVSDVSAVTYLGA